MKTSFCKFSNFFNSGISLNWSIKIDEVTTRNTTAYFFANSVYGGVWEFCDFRAISGYVLETMRDTHTVGRYPRTWRKI